MWSFLPWWMRRKSQRAGVPNRDDDSEIVAPLYVRDPERFIQLVKTDDPEARIKGLPFDLMEVATCEIGRYGLYHRPETTGDLRDLYAKWVMQMTEDRRWELYQHINRLVQDLHLASVTAYLPFICCDNSLRIVSTAVIDFASLGPI